MCRSLQTILENEIHVLRVHYVTLCWVKFYVFFLLGRSCGDSSFMEDFSDMLLLKLLNTSIIAADDNEKVCIYKSKHNVLRIRVCKIGSKST